MTETTILEPHSIEAEKAVLGALLIDSDQWVDVQEHVTAGDFYRRAHSLIFEAMGKVADERQAIDFLTVRDVLLREGQLEAIDGPAYLSSLTDGVPRSKNAADYARIVRDYAIRRALRQAGRRLVQDAAESDTDAAALLERAQTAIWGLAVGREGGDLQPAGELVKGIWPTLERLLEQGGGVTGVPTGFSDLDAITRGFQPTDLILLAGRPAMGKTAAALNIAAHAAKHGTATAVFSLEMSKEQLMFRLLAGVGHLDVHRLLSGRMHHSDYGDISTAMGQIAEWPLHIDDTGVTTVATIRAKARRLQMRSGLGLIVVDYLQLMTDPKRHESRVLELASISRGLKMLAKELRVPVLALSQLSRAVEARTEHRPQLSDLRESGSLEQDADVVLMLWREEEYRQTPQNAGKAELIVAKQRNGPTGGLLLSWLKEQTRFANLSQS